MKTKELAILVARAILVTRAATMLLADTIKAP